GFQRTREDQLAVSCQQREGKEQPRNKLAGHVARKLIPPWGKRSLDTQDPVFQPVGNPSAFKQLEIRIQGPLHQSPPACEFPATQQRQSDGNEKAQCGTRLSAI